MKTNLNYKKVLWFQIFIFVFIVIYFFPLFELTEYSFLFPYIALLGLLFLISGVVLMFIARKKPRRLRKYLMLAGFSAMSPLLFSILHNVFYALAEFIEVLSPLFSFLSGLSFIYALLISPITFIIGAVVGLRYKE